MRLKINKNNKPENIAEKDSYPSKPESKNVNDAKGQNRPPKGSEATKPQANNIP